MRGAITAEGFRDLCSALEESWSILLTLVLGKNAVQ